MEHSGSHVENDQHSKQSAKERRTTMVVQTQPGKAFVEHSKDEPGQILISEFLAESDVSELLTWLRATNRELSIEEPLVSGMTGASVLRAILHNGDGPDEKLILKIIPAAEDLLEPDKHGEALEVFSEQFVTQHMVSQPVGSFALGSGTVLMFQSLAGGSVENYSSLGALSGSADLRRAVSVVLDGLTQDAMASFNAHSLTLREVMTQQLRSKLSPDGSLTKWLSHEFGDQSLVSATLKFEDDSSGRYLLNPIAFMAESSTIGSRILRVLQGPIHGDLHLENVIIRIGRSAAFTDFRLIDFSYFDASSSLAIDAAILALSELQRRLVSLSYGERRTLLEAFDLDGATARCTPAVQDILRLFADASSSGRARAASAGFEDDWVLQWRVALLSGALVWASRSRLSFEDRVWFLELSARIASQCFGTEQTGAQGETPTTIGKPFDARRKQALELVDRLMEENDRFDGGVTTIGIIPALSSLSVKAQVSIVSAGWDIILGFDPAADVSGAPSIAAKAGVAVRILRPSQDLDVSGASTTWIAADGLIGTGYREDKTLLEWRAENLAGLSKMIGEVTRSSVGPIVVTSFGALDKKSSLFLEKLLDHAGPLARLVVVRSTEPSGIEEYEPIELVGDLEAIATTIPVRHLRRHATADRVFVPGDHGQPAVEISLSDRRWFAQVGGELVHSGVVLESQSVEGVGTDFYHGRTISWLELESGIDIPRKTVSDTLKSTVEDLLGERGPRRLTFRHLAGAGGTTLSRRLAWDLRERYPVLIYTKLLSIDVVIARFERLSYLTGARVLLILDGVPESLSSTLFERLQSDSSSVVLVLVERTTSSSSKTDSRVLATLSADETEQFRRIFTNLAPLRHNELRKLASSSENEQIPFLYALTAFQQDFHGVETYVARSLVSADSAAKGVLASLAVVQRYAGETVSSSVFAKSLNLPSNATVRLGESIEKRAAGLVVEEGVGEWRPMHLILARELMRQLFTANLSEDGSFISLTVWAEDFIETVSSAYADPLPDAVRQLLMKLFVLRENRDESAYGLRQRFSELVSDLPLGGRILVMRTLAETFSNDPHFWAHYARVLAYEGADYAGAYKTIDVALGLAREDPTIWHIRGVIGRRKVSDLISPNRVGIEDSFDLEVMVRETARVALDDLETAASLNDASRYPQIDIIFLAITVIEWARKFKAYPSHQALLSSADGEFYATMLDIAEDSLDELENLQPEDPGFQIADDARIKLHSIYDNYQDLIDGWRRKIGRVGVDNIVVRSRLARAYVQRAGTYAAVDFETTSTIAALMESNLRDNPGHIRSIREWLRVARRTGGGLDRASEYISYWVDSDPSRDARFYDYVVSALLTLQGRGSSLSDFERKLDWSKSRSQSFSRRRVIYEWLGTGSELAALVHNSDVADWDRRSERSIEPPNLRRVRGVIDSLKDAKSGYLIIEGGMRVFFTPGGRFVRGLNEGDRVTALIGFAYDGPEAWRVRPSSS